MIHRLRDRLWVLPVLVFVGIQCYFIFSQMTGAWYDEGIYATAGLRTFQGYGVSDRYLTWVTGSLLWPVIAGLGFIANGLIGERLFALAMSTIAMVAVIRGAAAIFGENAAFWTGVAALASAPFFALGHLAVHDLPALAGVALSLWATLKFIKADDRLWLVVIALAIVFATLSKYPMLIMAAPIALIIQNTRREKAVMDLAILAVVIGSILLMYFLPFRDQLSTLLELDMNLYNLDRATIAYMISFYSIIPVGLSLIGFALSGKFRPIAIGLLVAALIWPLIHIISGKYWVFRSTSYLDFSSLIRCVDSFLPDSRRIK